MATTEELLQQLLDMMRSGGGATGTLGGSLPPGGNKALDKLIQQFEAAERATKNFNKTLVVLTDAEKIAGQKVKEEQRVALAELVKQRKERKISEEQFSRGLRDLKRKAQELSETLGELNDESSKELLQKIKLLEKNEEYLKKVDDLKKSIFSLTGYTKGVGVAFATLGKIGAAAGGAIKGLQGNASGMEVAGALMTAGVEALGDASKLAGSTMGNMGNAMAQSTNPRIKALGLAAGVAGPLIGGLGEAAAKLAKFGIEVLLKEVEKSQKAFQDATNAGAMFADGVTGLRNAAAKSGLTVDQFAGVLKSHSATIAGSGLGVTEGAKRMGGALNAGGKQMKTEMLNLGYSFQEQAGLVAETMQQMKGSTVGKFSASDSQIAEQTMKYAENLRTIASITGEDAKKKVEQVKQQAAQLAFQQKLAQKSPEQQAAIMRAMSNMSEIERKNFMDMVNFGTVINKEGATVQALSRGMADSMADTIEAYHSGVLDDEKQRAIGAKHSGQIQKDMLAAEGIGLAGAAGVGGVAGALADVMGKELQYRIGWNKDAIEAGTKETKGQKLTSDPAQQEFNKLAQATQDLKIQIEKTLTPSLAEFAAVANSIIASLKDQMKDVKPGVMSQVWSGLGTVAEVLIGAIALFGGPTILGALTTMGAGIAAAGAATIAAFSAAAVAAVAGVAGFGQALLGLWKGDGGQNFINDAFKKYIWSQDSSETIKVAALNDSKASSNLQEYAQGGIASGSPSGFLAKLHGQELVLPMEGGKLDAGSQGFAELIKLLDSSKLTSNNTSSVSNAYSSSTANIANISSSGMSSPDFSGMLIEMSSAAKEQKDQTSTMFSTLQKFLQEASTPSSSLTGDQKKPDQALLMEVKKLTELLIEQNKLAEEAQQYRRTLVDTAESHLRTAERTLSEVS